MEQKKQNEHTAIHDRTFILVWIALIVLTGITVKAAQIQWGQWSMAVNLLIASAKATLVLWFFMHLKYEKLMFKLLFLIPIATITVIIWLTFFDIWYR